MTPHYRDETVTVYAGDCLTVLAELPDSSVDSIVTDPPYGLGFMGREWDDLPPGLDFAKECLRVLKPGGHMLAFGGSRTWHRLAAAVEDAGFEIRDSIAWLYGSGFPKSLDVSKAIDKAAGAERVPLGVVKGAASSNTESLGVFAPEYEATAPATPDAERWQGWGTALKPAFEPIVVGRKPLGAGTVAGNVLQHGTGALNVDACRINSGNQAPPPKAAKTANAFLLDGASDLQHLRQLADEGKPTPSGRDAVKTLARAEKALEAMSESESHPAGRWPTNVVLDDCQAAELDKQSGTVAGAVSNGRRAKNGAMFDPGEQSQQPGYADSGGASRFFPTFHYEAKAPTHERPREGDIAHPTVKPLDLMRWLVRLVTPPGGTVLDPFAGSGTTAEACVIEHFRCITIERETDYLPLIVARLTKPIQVGLNFDEEMPA